MKTLTAEHLDVLQALKPFSYDNERLLDEEACDELVEMGLVIERRFPDGRRIHITPRGLVAVRAHHAFLGSCAELVTS